MPKRSEFPQISHQSNQLDNSVILADLLNEVQVRTTVIKGYSQILVKSGLPDSERKLLEAIYERITSIEKILKQAGQYIGADSKPEIY